MADAGLRDALANYTGVYDNSTILPHDAAIAPQMIVVNPGLHPIFVGAKENDYGQDIKLMLSQMNLIATTQLQMPMAATRFVVPDITAVIDAQVTMFKVQLVHEAMAVRFNKALTSCLNAALSVDGSSQWLKSASDSTSNAYGSETWHGDPRRYTDITWGGPQRLE